jgi:hypothetical protein
VSSEFKKNNTYPDGYTISIKSSEAVITRALTKKVPDKTINVKNVPVKKYKKTVNDVL